MPPHPPALAAPAAPARTAVVDLGSAVAAALVVGIALGAWCRAWTDGSGGLVGSVLADLGAPWTLAAFGTGLAVAGRNRTATALDRTSGILAGGLAGAGALVVASVVYYDGSTGPRAILWAGLGLLVGAFAGGAGAAWALWPRSAAGAVAAAALGLAIAAEGTARLGGGLWMDGSASAELTVLAVVALGVLVPLVLTRGSALGVAGSVGVVTLALPIAVLLAAAPRLLALPPFAL